MTYSNDPDKSTRIVKNPNGNCEAHTESMMRYIDRKISDVKQKPYDTYLKISFFVVPMLVTFFIYVSSLERRIAILENNSIIVKELRDDIKGIRQELQEIRERITKLESKP